MVHIMPLKNVSGQSYKATIRTFGSSLVYFIINTKHCITYLALTKLFPVFMTSWSHIVKYTHYVAFAAFLLGVSHFFSNHECVQMEQMDFISRIFI